MCGVFLLSFVQLLAGDFFKLFGCRWSFFLDRKHYWQRIFNTFCPRTKIPKYWSCSLKDSIISSRDRSSMTSRLKGCARVAWRVWAPPWINVYHARSMSCCGVSGPNEFTLWLSVVLCQGSSCRNPLEKSVATRRRVKEEQRGGIISVIKGDLLMLILSNTGTYRTLYSHRQRCNTSNSLPSGGRCMSSSIGILNAVARFASWTCVFRL